MAEFKTKSGAALVVSGAEFGKANNLRKVVSRALGQAQVDGLGEAALQILTSDDAVEAAFMACAEKVIYDGAKFTPALFDDPALGKKARGDYFEVFAKVLEENLNPFFVHASSASSTEPSAAGQ